MKHFTPRAASKLLLLLLIPLANASELGLKVMHLPLFIPAATTAEGDEVHESPTPVSVLSRSAEPEATIHFLNSPHIPHHDTTWNQKTDTNLITLCGIKISQISIEPQEAPPAADSVTFSVTMVDQNDALSREEKIKSLANQLRKYEDSQPHGAESRIQKKELVETEDGPSLNAQIEVPVAPPTMEIRIDTSAFKKPDPIEMTDEAVMELIKQAVTLNFPCQKVSIIK